MRLIEKGTFKYFSFNCSNVMSVILMVVENVFFFFRKISICWIIAKTMMRLQWKQFVTLKAFATSINLNSHCVQKKLFFELLHF